MKKPLTLGNLLGVSSVGLGIKNPIQGENGVCGGWLKGGRSITTITP